MAHLSDPRYDRVLGVVSYKRRIIPISAATTLRAADSGSLCTIDGTTSNYTITLPTGADRVEGWNIDLFVTVNVGAAGNIPIAAGSAVMQGIVACADLNAAGDSASTTGGAVSNINLIASVATIGDSVSLLWTGARWVFRAYCAAVTAITLT